MGRSGLCIHGGRRHRLIASAKESLDLPVQIRERACGYRPARIDYDIPRCSQFREPAAHHFADSPPEAIADNGLPEGSRCGEPDSGARTGSRKTKSRKERPVVTETVVINLAEFAGS